MTVRIEASWKEHLQAEFDLPYWDTLTAFVKAEYAAGPCFPAGKNIFRAFDLTPFDDVKVVILGQDPYHTPGAAMGFCFSVPDGNRPQPSLQNIFQELEQDIGVRRTQTDLSDWAEQGVFLLNSVLTVRARTAGSHAGKGWENFTDSAIKHLSDERDNLVFILWGSYAISKKAFIDARKHLVLTSPHPSPFSAHKGFFGSKPFSRANDYLVSKGKTSVIWA
ncbi:uracil-DNA glycosylase [Janthinobacterium agaricidamnosum]|uniref:Uracil-DNA glycosylase n=1 Tax=Janthinobacterium agaricidamnosum NBRC 102515 = DSM 9628 TaxID=1349767 RepID=W0VFB8_9BURK|nr:uracil-DNA glycosylase [Janthinobacterium agaricidamnosum]CDG86052.1 uracil-DNA glycosylase [Janthinobacterium agaricidamnosum NBRC 102515 = DSM 9628]